MSQFDVDLCVVNADTLKTTVDLHKLVCGTAATGFSPKVRGTDTETGAVVGVAYYEVDYTNRADAAKRATEILHHVKRLV